ncbi:hypothetical protein ACC699_40235, partial [Rhizobium ruizarguesonis]
MPRERTNPAGKRPGKIGRAGKDAPSVEPLNIVHGALPSREVILRFIAFQAESLGEFTLGRFLWMIGDEAKDHLARRQ